jgi:hypothetical protein
VGDFFARKDCITNHDPLRPPGIETPRSYLRQLQVIHFALKLRGGERRWGWGSFGSPWCPAEAELLGKLTLEVRRKLSKSESLKGTDPQ